MKFETYKAGMEYVAKREAEIGKRKFHCSDEYHAIYPELMALYKSEGHKKQKRHRIEIGICIHA